MSIPVSLCKNTVRPLRLEALGDRAFSHIRSLTVREGGQVIVLFALAILPIAFIAGFAIDFQLLTQKKAKAQYSLDAAVIAGTRAYQSGASATEVTNVVNNYFYSVISNTEYNLECDQPTVTIDDTEVEAAAQCIMNTTLSAIAGIEEMKFKVETGTAYGIGKVDVSFVFDVSGSMSGTRISDLKVAAYDAVDILIPDDPQPGHEDDVRLSMVSYNGAFKAGPYFEDVTGQSPNQTYTYYSDGRWRDFDYTTTCVFERGGSEAFTAVLPGPGQYLEGADVFDRNDCDNASPPLELTANEESLNAYIEALEAGGNTAGHLGVAWGWYMISPEWASLLPTTSAPLPYDEPDSAKAIVLMTDGAFNTVGDPGIGSSTWQAKKVCDNIKAADIVIYSVAFQAPSAGEEVLQYCASDAESFFTPQNGEQLRSAYQAIASSISDLRISH
ncbi:pilus assembly protein TadG-related protein [Henriciella sp. AS95]|uniref:pilus assembly protein TadG-related protein n=1 Tax=Henriciella sp. AS95 TaxID=3135782 RepID=UPI00316DE7B7